MERAPDAGGGDAVDARPGLADLPGPCLVEVLARVRCAKGLAAAAATCRALRAAASAEEGALWKERLRARDGPDADAASAPAWGWKGEYERRVRKDRRALALVSTLSNFRLREAAHRELESMGLEVFDALARRGDAASACAARRVAASHAIKSVRADVVGDTAASGQLLSVAVGISNLIESTQQAETSAGVVESFPRHPRLAEQELRSQVGRYAARARVHLAEAERAAAAAARPGADARVGARALASAVLQVLHGDNGELPALGGSRGEYYAVSNSSLLTLFTRAPHEAIPITLAAAFCAVAEEASIARLGGAAEMVPMPAHFLVRVTARGCPPSTSIDLDDDHERADDEVFLDLFGGEGGLSRMLSRRDCAALMVRIIGGFEPRYLDASPLQATAVRMCNNIINARMFEIDPVLLQGRGAPMVRATFNYESQFQLEGKRTALLRWTMLLKRELLEEHAHIADRIEDELTLHRFLALDGDFNSCFECLEQLDMAAPVIWANSLSAARAMLHAWVDQAEKNERSSALAWLQMRNGGTVAVNTRTEDAVREHVKAARMRAKVAAALVRARGVASHENLLEQERLAAAQATAAGAVDDLAGLVLGWPTQ